MALTAAQMEAALIMRELKPKTMSEIFDAAKARLLAGFVTNLSDGGCENGHAEVVTNAHYRSLQDNTYRHIAGMKIDS